MIATLGVAAVAAGMLALPARAAEDATGPWPQFGGSSSHAGVAPSDGPAPPLRRVWRFPMPPGEHALSAPVVGDGVAVASGEHLVYGVDSASGELLWRLHRDGGSVLATPAIAEAGGTTMVLYTGGSAAKTSYLAAYSISGSSPSLLWKVKLRDRVIAGVTIDGDLALVADVSGNVYAVKLDPTPSAEGPEPEWRAEVPGVVLAPVAAASGRVFAVSRSESSALVQVTALDESDGGTAWSFQSPSATYGSPPTVANGQVVVGTYDNRMVALSAADGSRTWSLRLRSQFFPYSMILFSKGHLLAMPSRLDESGLYRIDAADGSRSGPWSYGDGLWDFEFGDSSSLASRLVVGDTVYAGFDGGMIAAVDEATGVEIWTIDTGDAPVHGLAPADGLLIASIATHSGGLAGYEHADGPLVHVVSGTKPNWGRMAANYALAFAIVGAVAALLFLLLRGRGRKVIPEPAGDLGPIADEGPA
ncbi:MAG TPA: PQQ-binding-like beta-propeller repeat protein [Actinomycetota bacterium]